MKNPFGSVHRRIEPKGFKSEVGRYDYFSRDIAYVVEAPSAEFDRHDLSEPHVFGELPEIEYDEGSVRSALVDYEAVGIGCRGQELPAGHPAERVLAAPIEVGGRQAGGVDPDAHGDSISRRQWKSIDKICTRY